MTGNHQDGNRNGLVIVGAVLLLAGLWAIGGLTAGSLLAPVFRAVGEVRTWFGPILVIGAGALLVVYGLRGGVSFGSTTPGARLYRSRDSKMVAGVLGGVAEYYSIDPTILRLLYVVVALLTEAGPFLIAYILAAIIVPVRPDSEPVTGTSQAPPPPPPPPTV